ncbi:MAG: tRNA adenosine(34) deaminase TadA [Clostridia bacterium]|nr:tRNA adenosine(34) deaminase TadA [Clostridia bacterium]MBQ6895435.1 tRNA adenosine(34) deaminase TadA [Clostridia bacterium]
MDVHEKFMKEALKEAKKAYRKGETPIGAVIVKDGKIIAKGHNKRETKKNALCHAEIIAINKACRKLGGWRLFQCDMYVTLEPCLMCAGAIVQSRIKNLYFGACDKKGGAVGSLIDIPALDGITQEVNTEGGILEDECSSILKDFFKELRKTKSAND